MIEVKSLTKTFKRDVFEKEFKALDDVSFSIGDNEIIGFLGANGAGKTTTNKILMDFIPKTHGSVQYDEKMGKDFYSIRKNIGYLPERPYFYPYLTGKMFLEYLGHLSNLSKTEMNEAIDKWTKRTKIHFALNQKIRNYSKGMLQRLGLASVLIHDPKVIILDEPLAGLDPIGRMDIKNIILDLHKEGKTIFFSSHIVSDVESICKKVVFLEKGKLVYEGSIDKIIQDNRDLKYEVHSFSSDHLELSIRPKYRENDIQIFEIEESKKNQLIKELIDKKIEIVGVSQIRPSLEEVIYKVRGNKIG